ncbi:MAG: hypothetical protein U5Q03_18585 [Bacteroidota bacterium]|nr:hypothetical protein [Bacteroidota bacterium]
MAPQDILTLSNYYVYPVPDQVTATTQDGDDYLEEQFTIDNTLYQTDQDYTSATYESKISWLFPGSEVS